MMDIRRLEIIRAIGIRWFGPLASRAKSREAIPGLSAEQRAGATSLAQEGFAIPLEEVRQACCAALGEALRARFS